MPPLAARFEYNRAMLRSILGFGSPSQKKRISESNAVEVVLTALRRSATELPAALQEAFEGKLGGLAIRNPDDAVAASFLALAAIELESLENVFPQQEARRLSWKFSAAIQGKLDADSYVEFGRYRAACLDSSRRESLHRLGELLLFRLLNPGSTDDPSPLEMSPLKTILTVTHLVHCCGTWKRLTETYVIVPDR